MSCRQLPEKINESGSIAAFTPLILNEPCRTGLVQKDLYCLIMQSVKQLSERPRSLSWHLFVLTSTKMNNLINRSRSPLVLFGSTKRHGVGNDTLLSSIFFLAIYHFSFKKKSAAKFMAKVTCLKSRAWVEKNKMSKAFKTGKKWNAWIKCDIFAPAKNLNVRKQKDSIWCDVIAVLLPFVPKTWHFWAWEEKQIRGADSFWVWERLVFISLTNLRWWRFGGDIKAGSTNLYPVFRQRYSNDKELKTEMEEMERKFMIALPPRQWLTGPNPELINCLGSDCANPSSALNIWSFCCVCI